MWILDIFLGTLNQAGGQVMSGLHSVILVTVFFCRVCNLEASVIVLLLVFCKKVLSQGDLVSDSNVKVCANY